MKTDNKIKDLIEKLQSGELDASGQTELVRALDNQSIAARVRAVTVDRTRSIVVSGVRCQVSGLSWTVLESLEAAAQHGQHTTDFRTTAEQQSNLALCGHAKSPTH